MAICDGHPFGMCGWELPFSMSLGDGNKGGRTSGRKEGRMCCKADEGKVKGTHILPSSRRHPQTCVNCIVLKTGGGRGNWAGKMGRKRGGGPMLF